MAINPYINSANIFVYPCANRKEGFWESKLATEYSLRTLIPWKVTKRSFVIADVDTAQELANKNNLEFVINGYYFNISDWKETIGYQNGTLWAHIKLVAKPLTQGGNTNEATEILALYDSQTAGTLDDANNRFQGIKFDQTAGTDSTTVFHLQIFDANGNILHRDMIKINCDDPLEQDDETGLLSLKYRSPLKVDNEELTLDYDSTLTLSSNKLSVTNPANTYIQPVTSGTHVSAGTLTYLKVGNNYYTIPQGKTYTASNQGITLDNTTFKLLTSDGLAIGVGDTGTNKYLRIALADSSGLNFDDSLPGKLSIKFADNSGLDKSNGLQIKVNATSGLETTTNGLQIKVNATSGLELTSDGLKMKYPLPSITGNKEKILAVNSTATGLKWITPPSGGSGTIIYTNSSATASYPSLKIGSGLSVDSNNILSATGGGGTYSEGNGISINSNNAISVSLATNSGLEFNSSKQLRLKKSNGINIDNNGVFIKLKSNSGLTCDTNGLAINNTTIGLATANSSPKAVKVLLKQAGLEKWKTVGQYYISTITSSNRLEHTVNVNLWPCPWNETYQATGSHFVLAGETYEPNYASLGNVSWDGVYIIPERTEAIVPSMILPGFHIATDTDPVSYQDLTSIDIGKIATLKFTYQTWE